MPELPEMENYKHLLNNKIKNKIISNVVINRNKSINNSVDSFVNMVKGKQIIDIKRRAKHLLFYLESGEILLLHLMLGGWMFYGLSNEKPDRTIQIQLSFQENHLYFIGLRLGYLHLFTQNELEKELLDLGPEPLDSSFTIDAFQQIISNKRGRIKTTLIDQKFLAGIGNRYADEICWKAKINPLKKMSDITEHTRSNFYQSIQSVLKEAIHSGGYMDKPLFNGDLKTGGYNNFFKVYNKEGENCSRCTSIIIKEEVSSRKVFYCPNCQQ
ncbi:DNA-formamidopyrimidine glycosylase [Aquibacillus rhizosphaerae]|uniref:Formamidopyrimidine-DNA glycosylase n=1 Tax=Aquibacillus rhizosphaerae TaxID=3051431 RepID=A0ABT7L4Y3_9BACI|nr:DNA-formamidopyrimidine glycosylase [Aquibacillus sp. LR5S19]MDL4839646.1 DNA-formamidopyrimidine glycosylase [Aquibacillus sp. LR5S19]